VAFGGSGIIRGELLNKKGGLWWEWSYKRGNAGWPLSILYSINSPSFTVRCTCLVR